MKENVDFQEQIECDIENPRELHAGEAESTPGTSTRRMEMALAGAASITLLAFLGALWKILA